MKGDQSAWFYKVLASPSIKDNMSQLLNSEQVKFLQECNYIIMSNPQVLQVSKSGGGDSASGPQCDSSEGHFVTLGSEQGEELGMLCMLLQIFNIMSGVRAIAYFTSWMGWVVVGCVYML